MNCTNCGTPLPSNAKFCSHCAHAVQNNTGTAPTSTTKSEFMPSSALIRLVDYIIDHIVIYILVFILSFFLSSIPAMREWLIDTSIGAQVASTVFWTLFVVVYYMVLEATTQRTVAKFITRTKVVMRDGSKPPFKNILGRSFARLIPFDEFSFLVSTHPAGWHDRLSKTIVVPKSYTADDVKKIDIVAASGGNSNVLKIILIVFGVLIVIAIMGILSSIVLVSLNSARMKGQDAEIKSALVSMRPAMEMYYINHGNTYSKGDSCFRSPFSDLQIPNSLPHSGEFNPTCLATGDSYAVSAKLKSTTDIYCVDSTGYADKGKIVEENGKAICKTE